MGIALLVIAGWMVIGCLLTIGQIGKPKRPTTPGVAAIAVMLSAAMIVVLVVAAGRVLGWS